MSFIHIADILEARKREYKKELEELQEIEKEVNQEIEEERQMSFFELVELSNERI